MISVTIRRRRSRTSTNREYGTTFAVIGFVVTISRDLRIRLDPKARQSAL
ncbi:MAG TPA: hypothetical protein VNZ26_02915 [Vicinamibacterales bacterium]|jgi:hypothetical protein|nr:hypothetical protein [Vicinamibacterales bacterium]